MNKSNKQGINFSNELHLPLDFVTQSAAILAKRRVGKTYTASVIAEEMVRLGLPFVALDPTGAWWGLCSSADGQKEGLPVVVIGGAHGHIPLESSAGAVVAELVVDHPGFYVIDMSTMETNAEQDRFACDFATRLYRYKEGHREPLHLFVDEADCFAPQRPFENQKKMLGAFETLIRRGGIFGIGMTMITQRPAVLNKNVLTQSECLIVLQLPAPQDQDAIDDWVKRNGTKEQRDIMMNSLASLKKGEAWVWSPSWLEVFEMVHIRERHTFNSSATPKSGEVAVVPKRFAKVDIDNIKEKIAGTIEKQKQNDPKELRRRIHELEKALKSTPAAVSVNVPMITDEEKEEARLLLSQFDETIARYQQEAHAIFEQAERMQSSIRNIVTAMKSMDAAKRTPPAISTPLIRARPVEAKETTQPGMITLPQQRILDSIAWIESLGLPRPHKTIVAFLSGQSPKSSAFGDNYRTLKTLGFINYSGDLMEMTNDGRRQASEFQSPLTPHEVQDAIIRKIPDAQARIIKVLIENYPNHIYRTELAEQSGQSIKSSAFGDNLRDLKKLGVIDYTRDTVKALPVLFLE